jgi:hypothetical protein
MKYNYVILSTDWDVYRQLYDDVAGRDDVCYVAGPQATKRGLGKILYRAHFNRKLNRVIPLPFKGLWNHSYFTLPFKDKKPICFILFRDWVSMDPYTEFISWLKRRYPGSKYVWFLHDFLENHNDFYTGEVLDIEHYKQVFDLVFSCHPSEALELGLVFHKVPISKLFGDSPANRCDVLFVGKDKGRLDRLVRIYDVLTRKGARCRFFVSGASSHTADPAREGIVLLDSPMPYRTSQEWIAESNCLLELRCDSRAGETLRVSEALIYGKKLITDYTALEGNPCFDSDNIRFLASDDDVEGVDMQFMTTPLDVSPEKKEAYRKELSPTAFLEEIDALLN